MFVFVLGVAEEAGTVDLNLALLVAVLQAQLHVLAQGLALLLSEGCHNRQQDLTLGIHGVNVFLFKVHGNILFLQLADVFQAVQGIARKPADGFGYHHINVACHTLVNHAVEFLALLGVGAGNAVVYVNAVFDTRKIPNKQGLSAVSLRRKPSFFMLVFCFSATLPTRV